MGRLIDCDNAYNAIQITADRFGVASMVVWRAMCNMLSKIPTVDAIRIPENATNGDMIKAIFPLVSIATDGVYVHVGMQTERMQAFAGFEASWWNAPYKGSDTRYAVLYANDKPIVCEPLPAQCQNEEENK